MTEAKVPMKLRGGYVVVSIEVDDSGAGEYLNQQDLMTILEQNIDVDNIPRDVDRMVKHNIEANR